MNVRIKVCGANYSLRRAAKQLADEIRRAYGLDIPLESGHHGQYEVFVDGELVVPPGFGGNRRPSTNDIRRCVLAGLANTTRAERS